MTLEKTILIELPLRLPGLNEYTCACRSHPVIGNNMKKATMKQIQAYLPPLLFKNIISMKITYVEPNKRRDIDNIFAFGAKCILDAMVGNGNLIDDSQEYIKKLTQEVEVEKGVKKIIIEINMEN